MKRILVVEDEEHIAKGIEFNLEQEGFESHVVFDGESALDAISEEDFAAIVLDVMLPGIDGFEVARAIRSGSNFIPILMLTARSRPEDVITGFEAGADDYLPKPFELSIFLARLNGLLRRSNWSGQTANKIEIYEFAGNTFDFNKLELTVAGRVLTLTLMEAKLLRHLIVKKGEPVSRNEILEEVWGLSEDTDTRAIDNFIVRLRKYLEPDVRKPKLLTTVRGVGYKFNI